MGLFSGTAEERFDALMIMLADHYGFQDAADCRDRLERASVLLDAPVPVIAVAHALPPHDPEVDELVRSWAVPEPVPTSLITVNMQSPSSVLLSIATSALRKATPRLVGLLWRRLPPDGAGPWELLTHFPPEHFPTRYRFSYDEAQVGRGDRIEFALSWADTRGELAGNIVPQLEVSRPDPRFGDPTITVREISDSRRLLLRVSLPDDLNPQLKPAIFWRDPTSPTAGLWRRFWTIDRLLEVPAFDWDGHNILVGDSIELGLADAGTDPTAAILKMLEVRRP